MLSRLPTRCAHCKVKFTAEERGKRLHNDCIAPWAAAFQEKQKRKAVAEHKARLKVERAVDRRRRESFKSLRDLLSEAQVQFNKFVRMRDELLPCVSCGETNPAMTVGGQWDCGHFLSRGAHPELRFTEDNTAKQCKSCNAGSGKFAHKERTVSQRFEEELRRRIGDERVDFLKGPHPAKKWERDELIAIKALYVSKLKQLKGN